MTPPTAEASVQTMFAQSSAVLSQPSSAIFERFERAGGTKSAFTYVLISALVSALIAALGSLFNDNSFIGQFIGTLISVPLSFFVFTGAVYFIGKNLFKGTGTYPEVAYSFSLFYVPLSILATVIGIIPILGWAIAFLIGIAMIYFGYLAVRSSMNISDTGTSIATLVLSWIASAVVGGILISIVQGIFK